MPKNSQLYEIAAKDIVNLFKQADKEPVLLHSKRTVYWLLKLKPDADEPLKIAALAHDIERISPPPSLEHMIAASSKGWRDPEFLRLHSEKGAEIIEDVLKRLSIESAIIKQVKFFVAGHEFSGTDDQNVLKDADSISFFENNITEFITIRAKQFGKEKVKEKFQWMFNRITLDSAKQIALPWFNQAIGQLD